MEQPRLTIRTARSDDAERVAEIYDYHVRHGIASFDSQGLSVAETGEKILRILERNWPFLVAEMSGIVVGYAYATQLRDRPGYGFACEDSIYVDEVFRGQGVGSALLQTLCEKAEARGFRQMLAVIADGEEASVRLHESCGFHHAGRMHAVGWKMGRWVDTVYMQKPLGAGSSEPPRQRTSCAE